jgi:hypothetical protein
LVTLEKPPFGPADKICLNAVQNRSRFNARVTASLDSAKTGGCGHIATGARGRRRRRPSAAR